MSFKFNFHNLIYATKFEHMTRGARTRAWGTRRAGRQPSAPLCRCATFVAAGRQKKRQPRIGWCFVRAHIQNLRFNLAPSLGLQLNHHIFHFLFGFFFVAANSEKLFPFSCIWKRQFVFKLKVINVFKE